MREGLTLIQICPFRDPKNLVNLGNFLARLFKKLNDKEVNSLSTALADLISSNSFTRVDSEIMKRAKTLEEGSQIALIVQTNLRIPEISNPIGLWMKILVDIFDNVFA